MQTPYEILEVAADAGDDDIKKAYLRKVREFPPEREGAAFQRIRDAYERIATDKRRRQYHLFDRGMPDVEDLLARALKPGRPVRPDAATLIGALAEAAKQRGRGAGDPR